MFLTQSWLTLDLSIVHYHGARSGRSTVMDFTSTMPNPRAYDTDDDLNP